jgi:hypothetical protein
VTPGAQSSREVFRWAADTRSIDGRISTFWEWLAFAGIAVVLCIVAYAVVRVLRAANDRSEATARSNAALLAKLPPEFRRRAEPLWMRISVLALALGAALAAWVTLGKWAVLIAFGLVVLPFYLRTLARQRMHREEIIRAVRRDFPTMPPDELGRLIRALELAHGRAEMRPLRRLVTSVKRGDVQRHEPRTR